MIYIYKHKNKINSKVYIGQTNDTKTRWKPSAYKESPRFYNAIQKYGWDNFTHEILSEIEDQNEADNQEIALIEYFDSTNPENGYNISYGGNTPLRGRGEYISGDKNGMYGKHHSEETKRKMKENHYNCSGVNNPNYGKHLSFKTKEKLSVINTGKHHSEETKKRMSDSKKGSKHPNAKPVYLIDTIEGSAEYYACIKDIYERHPDWNYSSLKYSASKNSLFKKRYRIKYKEN